METPVQTAQRLLTALEELVGQETLLVRTMDFVEAVAVRERAAPLVEKLCALAAVPAVASLRPRVDLLLERSGQNHHFLDAQLARLQGELARVNEARGRLRRVAPAYGQPAPVTQSRLNTAA
ncbi:hypothetical protein Verru16b_02163 [Lacunisphaera limnophila]|uniref:FlgN protein n=1 Tax=Lacunisphaera limnophila TaxID=1838286 RepID=A0A1D8AW24_9BACT|nr:hypothetical protein [Lacunisphaera limnophila]AOS45087.1 hypothetical protein Verru16b_02163 [Lacunisphaera limnophila]